MNAVQLRCFSDDPCERRGEPVTVGLPWPRGTISDQRLFRLNTSAPLQTRVLERWPDGSIRWCLFDFRATTSGNEVAERIELGDECRPVTPSRCPAGYERVLELVQKGIQLELDSGPVAVAPLHWTLTDAGPVRFRWQFTTQLTPTLILFGSLDLFAEVPTARIQMTLRNTRAAEHPGGTWDLGGRGSAILKRWAFVTNAESPRNWQLSIDRGQGFQNWGPGVLIDQSSSGGENWQSENHWNTRREVPFPFRGYRVMSGEQVLTAGYRSTPILLAESDRHRIGMTMPRFWENFPKRLGSHGSMLSLELFPGETELQGGEQKTHCWYLSLGQDDITVSPMAWCRSPLVIHPIPEWYASCEAVAGLTPRSRDPNSDYLRLVDQAIEGPHSFFQKREIIDEYGWRNYGDVFADHEAVRASLISHYNNQYDCVAGFTIQFMRSNDSRWWNLMLACAEHTVDIDIYHTDDDKPAYNNGLFWHTYHYATADTSTHRSYPRQLQQSPVESQTRGLDRLGQTGETLKAAYAVGGGPSASHAYSHGLLLAYFLTGEPRYAEAVLGLANQILTMEDPLRTPFHWLSTEFTGLATDSQAGYHGPGRASGNAISVLLDGYRLSGEIRFLQFAEQLLRRVSAPHQNLDDLDLLNAEERWFYTVHLQAVGKYLGIKAELSQYDDCYGFARETLLHYARWMQKHERPALDHPERLQYPTETWAAQEMRKVEVFQFAASHSTGAERQSFLDRAEWFFHSVEQTLSSSPTRHLARPVVLLLNFGWSRARWMSDPPKSLPASSPPLPNLSPWTMFVPQKQRALRRAKLILVLGFVLALGGCSALIGWLLNRS